MLVPEGMSFDFPDPSSAKDAPLAQELFMYPFVDRVFYMSNFVTVTKKENVEWLEVQSILREHIQKFLESGKLILDQGNDAAPQSKRRLRPSNRLEVFLTNTSAPLWNKTAERSRSIHFTRASLLSACRVPAADVPLLPLPLRQALRICLHG